MDDTKTFNHNIIRKSLMRKNKETLIKDIIKLEHNQYMLMNSIEMRNSELKITEETQKELNRLMPFGFNNEFKVNSLIQITKCIRAYHDR